MSGDVNPSGHLPLTFPAALAQAPRPEIPGIDRVHAADAANAREPIGDLATIDITDGVTPFEVYYPEGADVGYRWYRRTAAKPLFPFGFGLAYTRFADRDPRAGPGRVSFTNIGKMAGADVPQDAKVALKGGATLPRLVGFERVALRPGESEVVTVSIDPRLISDHAASASPRITASVRVMVGHDVETPVLTGMVGIARYLVRRSGPGIAASALPVT